jgi:hypothetical protein
VTRPREAGGNGRGERPPGQAVTRAEVRRILEAGRLLAAVLTSEELAELQTRLDHALAGGDIWLQIDCPEYR